MISLLLEPFSYDFMRKAMLVVAIIGLLSGLLSAFLVLRGWALVGDAFAHAIVPGVAGAYLLGLPFALGAFFAGAMAAGAMLLLDLKTKLRQDAIIGLIFSAFFAIGLFIASLAPIAVDISNIALGNILAISNSDVVQIAVIAMGALIVLALKWRPFMMVFFDETIAASLGFNIVRLKIVFFIVLVATIITSLHVVGAFLVVALLIIPGACAYLLTDRFGALLAISGAIGMFSASFGTYLSYFLALVPGGFIIFIQSLIFCSIAVFAPRYGLIATRGKSSRR